MTCPVTRTVLRPDLSDAERLAVISHVATCSECARATQILVQARNVLAEHAPALDDAARYRLSQSISGGTSGRYVQRWLLLAVAGAGLASIVVLAYPSGRSQTGGIMPTAQTNAPNVTTQASRSLSSGDNRTIGRAHLTALSDSVLSSRQVDQAGDVYLEVGRVEFDVEPLLRSESFAVHTAQVDVVVVGTSFRVFVEPSQTTVEVLRGKVKVNSGFGDELVRFLVAGESATFHNPDRRLDAEAVHNAVLQRPPKQSSTSEKASRVQQPEPPMPESARMALVSAWSLLETHPEKAIAVARELSTQEVVPSIRVEALAILADGLRRTGQHAEAAAAYADVAAHPSGDPFAEEALLQRALILNERLHDPASALVALDEANRRFPKGPLAPERGALARRIHAQSTDRRRVNEGIPMPWQQMGEEDP